MESYNPLLIGAVASLVSSGFFGWIAKFFITRYLEKSDEKDAAFAGMAKDFVIIEHKLETVKQSAADILELQKQMILAEEKLQRLTKDVNAQHAKIRECESKIATFVAKH